MELRDAILSKDMDAIRQALERGADPNGIDPSGFRPLHLLAAHGPAEAIAMLVERGADPEGRERYGDTPSSLRPA